MAINRVTGFSGFDVDATVKKMMDAEKLRLTKVQQNKQYKVWEQEAYRDVIKQFNTFKGEYFDVLKSEKNMRSSASFAKFSSSISVNGAASSKVSVIGGGNLQNLNQTIEYVSNLASKDNYTSSNMDLATIESGTLDFGAAKPAVFKTTMVIGSVSKSIEVDMSTITDKDQFGAALQAQVSAQFGANYANVVDFSGANIKFKSPGNTVTLLNQTGSESSMTWLGVASGSSTASYANKPISDVLGMSAAELSSMTINGKKLSDMGILETDTMSKMITKINDSGVGATASYNSLSDKFVISASREGTANKLNLSADFKTRMNLDTGTYIAAENAILSLNGVEIVQDSNSFLVEGMQITLNAEHAAIDGPIKIDMKVDSTKIIDQIKGFLDVYNGLVKSVGSLLGEKVYREFKPLTDEQKEAMSEKDVENWEKKSRSGVLKGKFEIDSILNRMRQALSEKVEGVGLTLEQIGIDTTSNYQDRGKLVIEDEQKLKSALENNYSEVVKLFSNESDKTYSDKANANERYKENGLANRLYDIMEDSISTRIGTNGKRGTLVEYAGLENTATVTENVLSKRIGEYDTKISQLMTYLQNKESYYFSMFSRMETAINKMNSQSSAFAQAG